MRQYFWTWQECAQTHEVLLGPEQTPRLVAVAVAGGTSDAASTSASASAPTSVFSPLSAHPPPARTLGYFMVSVRLVASVCCALSAAGQTLSTQSIARTC